MTYHFIGIGGIGMSALARVLLQKGERVQGSDAAASPLLEQLEKEGAKVRVGHDAGFLADGMTVVYSTDIKETNPEGSRARALGLPFLHRSEMLDRLMREKKGLLVTGTHGKTTTAALLAEVLCEAGADPSFVVGGILRSQNTNGKAGSGTYFVAEADESDGSFLRTPGYGAIVTNLEDEHLNYWGGSERLDLAFGQFFRNVKHPEHLFWCADDPRLLALKPGGVSYGFSEKAQWRISNYRQTEKGVSFDLSVGKKVYPQIELALLGRHNALNGTAVFGLAASLQIEEGAVRAAFRKFLGTKRRLEWKGEEGQVAVYDDYGHHPTEIAATVQALRGKIGKKRLFVVFQPHRYTRVRDLFEEFLSCFGDADGVVLTDIYGAGEAPVEGISTEKLHARMREKLGLKLHYIPRKELEEGIAGLVRPNDVVLTIGAGDVTRAGDPLLQLLRRGGR